MRRKRKYEWIEENEGGQNDGGEGKYNRLRKEESPEGIMREKEIRNKMNGMEINHKKYNEEKATNREGKEEITQRKERLAKACKKKQ